MRILIVEDDPMVGQINSRFASKIPFVTGVTLAASTEEAKAVLHRESFDLLLLDVYFPTGKGPELLQWIRNRDLPVQVIFITADNSRQTVERAFHLGALDYLVKPFTFTRFKRAVEQARHQIQKLSRSDKFDQTMLDRVFHGEDRIPDEEKEPFVLDKGMSYKTYELVKNHIDRINDSFTADELGEALGIARVTIRRYLDFMERQGFLEVRLQYGKIGRPQHYYYRKGKL